jgi:hypothetical protein
MEGVVNATPLPFYPLGKRILLIVQQLGGPRGLSGWVRKTSPKREVKLRTVQAVASCYIDCALPSAK